MVYRLASYWHFSYNMQAVTVVCVTVQHQWQSLALVLLRSMLSWVTLTLEYSLRLVAVESRNQSNYDYLS